MKNEILIMDIIGKDMFGAGITAPNIKDQLDSFDGSDITVRVNSPGGDVFEGLTIFNLLDQYAGNVTVMIDGYAASIASVIALAGDERKISENAMFMLHNPFTFAVGDASDMRKQADLLDKVKDSLITTYHSKTGMDGGELSDIMDAETWWDAEQSKANGFATSIIEPKSKLSNIAACRWINKAPEVEELVKPDQNHIDGLARSIEQDTARREISAMRKELAR